MTSMTLMPLFASNLVLVNLDKKFNNIDKDKIKFNLSTLGKNQNTDISDSMYVLEDYLELGHHILDIFHEFTFNTLKLKTKFTFSTSWFTRCKPNDFCRFHNHCNSFYSGLFYFDDYDDNSGDICFLNPNNQIEKFLITIKDKQDANIYNSKEWFVKPKKNLLLFFPSYLWHAVMNNTSDNPRHSLAFNFIPLGEYGVGDSTYNTNWFHTGGEQ